MIGYLVERLTVEVRKQAAHQPIASKHLSVLLL